MKTGEIYSNFLLITPGAKSNHTQIWKAYALQEEIQKALDDFQPNDSLPELEQGQELEKMVLQSAPKALPLTLTLLKNVQKEEAERYQKNYRNLEKEEYLHIAKTLHSDYREKDQSFVLVTEYLQGTTLNRSVSQRGPNGPWGLKACQAILKALHEIHQKNIIHGGLRPDSIVFTEDDGFKIRGFGILELLGGSMGSRAPRGPGALRFVPKELWEKEIVPNQASDLYSLGIILYYLLSGSLPIKGDKPSEIYSEITQGDAPFVSVGAKNPNLPAPMVKVIDGMVEKLPENRISWDEIWKILADFDPDAQEHTQAEPATKPHQKGKKADPPMEKPEKTEKNPPFASAPHSSQIEDLQKKNRFLQDLLFTFVQRGQVLQEKSSTPLEALNEARGEMEKIFKKYGNIVSAVRDVIGQVEKLKTILEKNLLPENLTQLPSIEIPSIFEKEEFFCAYEVGKARILGHSSTLDGLLSMISLLWIGTIEKGQTSDLRVDLAEIATQTPSVVLMDFSSMDLWDQITKDLIAGFLSALAGKKTHSILYGAPSDFRETLEGRQLTATFIPSLADLEGALAEFRKRVAVILYPKGRKDYKNLANFTQNLIDKGYTHFLADLSSKAIRGDDMEGLLEFHKLCKKAEVRGEVCSVTAEMKTVFKIMDLQDLQESYSDTQSALEKMEDACYSIEVRQLS